MNLLAISKFHDLLYNIHSMSWVSEHIYARARVMPMVAAACLLLSGCLGNQTPEIEVNGSRAALEHTLRLVAPLYRVTRAAAPLSVYVNLYLAGGGFVPVSAARAGVLAEARMHSRPTEEDLDDAFGLLQEFGLILQVDIPDLLNRSDDRSQTLDDYTEGLTNITERSRMRAASMTEYVARLTADRRTARTRVSDTERQIRQSLQDQDYVTAGGYQRDLGEAQSELSNIESELREQETLQSSFEELIAIADERLTAIEQNREVLVAGLKVVEIPGIENLGILEQPRTRRRSGNGGTRLPLF